jgi:hypothetical protein
VRQVLSGVCAINLSSSRVAAFQRSWTKVSSRLPRLKVFEVVDFRYRPSMLVQPIWLQDMNP